ncbi:MAG: hypothetical protein M1812_000878 [Candelaria pacifica]|nr:MAG: hypothetical protein M1812_000878 [Candelaria pacifica]
MRTPDDESEDHPVLSSTTLALLQEFYSEQGTQKGKLEDLKAGIDVAEQGNVLTMEAFIEDWNASQFWYEDETAKKLARQMIEGATNECHIAVVSAPSVFIQIKNLLVCVPFIVLRSLEVIVSYSGLLQSQWHADKRPKIYLLEFDQRFDVFGEFIKYDFEQPTRLPAHLKASMTGVVCDPPFLSEDCQTKGKPPPTAALLL